jgi:hypothetical protein
MPIKCAYDRKKLDTILAGQCGVVSRRQALDSGMTPSAIDYLLRPGGPWRRLLRGVYVTTTGSVTGDQRAVAALLYAGDKAVITGAVAVRRHRLACAGLNEIDVLVPRGVRVQSAGFVRVSHTTRMPARYYQTGGIRFTVLPRAVADAARGMSRLSDVRAVVAESIQRGGCELLALIEELRAGPSAGSRHLATAIAEVSEGIRSAAEADLRFLINKSDLEKPMYNPRLYAADGTFLAEPDAWWRRAGVAAEVDSRQYHLSPDDHERTTLRHNRMAAQGITLLHFLPGTLRSKSPVVVRDLRAAIESGNRRSPLPITAVPPEA